MESDKKRGNPSRIASHIAMFEEKSKRPIHSREKRVKSSTSGKLFKKKSLFKSFSTTSSGKHKRASSLNLFSSTHSNPTDLPPENEKIESFRDDSESKISISESLKSGDSSDLAEALALEDFLVERKQTIPIPERKFSRSFSYRRKSGNGPGEKERRSSKFNPFRRRSSNKNSGIRYIFEETVHLTEEEVKSVEAIVAEEYSVTSSVADLLYDEIKYIKSGLTTNLNAVNLEISQNLRKNFVEMSSEVIEMSKITRGLCRQFLRILVSIEKINSAEMEIKKFNESMSTELEVFYVSMNGLSEIHLNRKAEIYRKILVECVVALWDYSEVQHDIGEEFLEEANSILKEYETLVGSFEKEKEIILQKMRNFKKSKKSNAKQTFDAAFSAFNKFSDECEKKRTQIWCNDIPKLVMKIEIFQKKSNYFIHKRIDRFVTLYAEVRDEVTFFTTSLQGINPLINPDLAHEKWFSRYTNEVFTERKDQIDVINTMSYSLQWNHKELEEFKAPLTAEKRSEDFYHFYHKQNDTAMNEIILLTKFEDSLGFHGKVLKIAPTDEEYFPINAVVELEWTKMNDVAFIVILTIPQTRNLFFKFLCSEHSEENLMFLTATNDFYATFESGNEVRRALLGEVIVKEYVRDDSKHMINIRGETKDAILKLAGNGEWKEGMFVNAQMEVFKMIENDTFHRFRVHNVFKKVVKLLNAHSNIRIRKEMLTID